MFKNSSQRYNTLKFLAVCGIIGPITYVIVLVTLGFLQPDYNCVKQSMSELGAIGAPYALIMNTIGFPLLGLLIIAFALGLHRGIKGRLKTGPMLMVLSGFSLIMTGIFPCDPGCVDVTISGLFHSIFATIAAFSMILAPLFLLPRLKKDRRWQGYVNYSIVSLIAATLVSAMYGSMAFEQWTGVLQRISMGIMLLWVEIMAIRLLYIDIQIQ